MKSGLLFHKQETPYSCVPACLRIVLSSFGYNITEGELSDLCDCTVFGSEALAAVDAVRKLGFSNSIKSTLLANELADQIDDGIYPIVFVSLLPIDGVKGGHAVVAISLEQDSILVYDPLKGERSLQRSTFDTAWAMMHNIAIIVQV